MNLHRISDIDQKKIIDFMNKHITSIRDQRISIKVTGKIQRGNLVIIESDEHTIWNCELYKYRCNKCEEYIESEDLLDHLKQHIEE